MIRLTFLLPTACCLLILAACSPQQRLARLLKHHPELIKTDTVWKKDTVIVDGVTHDTVFKNSITRDTVIIKDKQLTIKYFNTGDSIYIKGSCDTIKLIREIPVIVNKVDFKESAHWYDTALRWFFVFIILLAVARIIQKKYF